MSDEDKSLVKTEGLGIPMIPIKELKKLTAYVNEVKSALMQKGRDYIVKGKKQYTARSGFAKLAQGFALSDDPPQFTTIYYDEPKTFEFTHYINQQPIEETITTKVYGFEAIVRVVNISSGRYAHGEGACTVEELQQTNNMTPKWYHRCKATAKTRALNRAISNYVGSADISAEEMGFVYEDGTDEPGRKEVPSEQSFPLPEPFDLPTWDFKEALRADGWSSVANAFKAWIADTGLDPGIFEIETDVARAVIRCTVYLGESFGPVSRMLAKANFIWRKKEKRWVLMKPEGVQ